MKKFEQDSYFIICDEAGNEYATNYFTAKAALIDATHLAYHTGEELEVWENDTGILSFYSAVTQKWKPVK
jgi:hypothetical protein